MSKKSQRIEKVHLSSNEVRISRERLGMLEEIAKQNDVKTDVIFQLKAALRRALENQERLLNATTSMSKQLMRSETALNLYREIVLDETKRRLGEKNFGVVSYDFDTERGWVGKNNSAELFLAK